MLPAGDGHGGMVQALLQSLATNYCRCFHDILWSVMKILDSSWLLNSLMWQLQGLRMKQQSSHVLLSLANLLQWQLGWTQTMKKVQWVHMSTFQISHTAFVLPCSLHVKRLLGLCQPSVCRGMSRRSRRSSCPPASTHPWPPRPPFRMAGWTLTCGVKGEFKVEMDGHSVMTAAESMWFHITIIHYHGRKTYDIVFSRTQHLNRRHRHERHGKNILKLRKLKVILQSRFNRVLWGNWSFFAVRPTSRLAVAMVAQVGNS